MWPFDAVIERIGKLEARLADVEGQLAQIQLAKIRKTMEAIMSKISEFAIAMSAFNDRQDAAMSGLQGDVTEMKALIEKLQNSAGEISPEDQKSLDELQKRAEAATAKLEALDAMTPPVVPAG